MSEFKMPELPAIVLRADHHYSGEGLADAVRAYALQVVEECAKICDTTPPYPFRPSIEAAHAIRQRFKS